METETNLDKKSTYIIRSASIQEVKEIHIGWAIAEQWNPGKFDWQVFPAVDPEGFLVGELDGKIITCISAIKINEDYGFIGFYICKKEYRGFGYGLKIFRAALDRLSEQKCIGLDGVEAQIPNYIKSGFSPYFQSQRHMLPSSETVEAPLGEDSSTTLITSRIMFENAGRLMEQIQGVNLLEYFLHLSEIPEIKCVGLMHADELAGFGVIRPANQGWRIGPLYALSSSIAEKIFQSLVAGIPKDTPVFLDIPMNNPAAVSLAKTFGLISVFPCMRMYTSEPPITNNSQLFGLLSWEIGP